MLTPPEGLDHQALVSTLARRWGIKGDPEYRPVGWGSHHWNVDDRWFVTVDELTTKRQFRGEPLDLVFDRLTTSLAAAAALSATGHEFVVAPAAAEDGTLVSRLDERLAVAVYPYIAGQSFDWAQWASREHRRAAVAMVVALHTSIASGPADVQPIPYRDELEAAMSDEGLDCGPFARPAAELLARHASPIRRLLMRYDTLAAGSDPTRAVMTHGEPHPGNTMLTSNGWLLIDWDTAASAPPERDLWSLAAGDESVLADYAEATGVTPQPDLMELYRIRWDLADVAGDVARFRSPHSGNADDAQSWTLLRALVEQITALSG